MEKISEKEYIASYDEINDLIYKGYKPLSDLRTLIDLHYINQSHKKIRTYIDHETKIVDVYGGAIARKWVWRFNGTGEWVYYPIDRDYLVE